MDRLAVDAGGDFLAANDEELIGERVRRVQTVDVGEQVVVGQDEELIAMQPVPGDDFVRCAIAAIVDGVRVRVPLEPTHGHAARLLIRRAGILQVLTGDGQSAGAGDDERGEKQESRVGHAHGCLSIQCPQIYGPG